MKNRKTKIPLTYFFFPAAILYLELVFRTYVFGIVVTKSIFAIVGFSLSTGLIIAFLCELFEPKWSKRIAILILVLICFVFGAQSVYYTIFKTFFMIYSISGTGKMLEHFWRDMLLGIWESIIPIILIFLPLVIYTVFGKYIRAEKKVRFKMNLISLFGAAAAYILSLVFVLTNNFGVLSGEYLYNDTFVPELSVANFGLVTTERLDIKHMIFGSSKDHNLDNGKHDDTDINTEGDEVLNTSVDVETNEDSPPRGDNESAEQTTSYNVMEIDFDTLIKAESDDVVSDMHKYFSRREATEKNEYTGMFEGKNLIWIVGEAFSTLAVDEDLTPTLYKLSQEGFVFDNFYNPVWNVSTSDGEYVTTTGLIPKSGVWSYYKSASNYMPFGFGNMFGELDYGCYAYHNHDYTYYRRDISYPNMGYVYKGVGNGLEITEQWPESDLEMMEQSIPDYINDENFMVYYLTVSGHLNYNFYGNAVAAQHKDEVEHLPYSEAARAYLACNVELDRAMEYLMDALEAEGILEDTVIVLSGDHYPYGLEVSEMEEIAGHPIETDFELYKSTLIIWSGSMEEPIHVSKVCSSLDIMPTLANLMGLEYDSRVIIGRDILSDCEGLVIFNNRSWMTERGKYSSVSGKFIPGGDAETVDEEYVLSIMEQVNEAFYYSEKILDTNYYGILFNCD